MRIGQRANLLRAAAMAQRPYARCLPSCHGFMTKDRCSCGFLIVEREVKAALGLDAQTRRSEAVQQQPSPVGLMRRERKRLERGAGR